MKKNRIYKQLAALGAIATITAGNAMAAVSPDIAIATGDMQDNAEALITGLTLVAVVLGVGYFIVRAVKRGV